MTMKNLKPLSFNRVSDAIFFPIKDLPPFTWKKNKKVCYIEI